MSKKTLVKRVIGNLLEEGNDFGDLTQGSLVGIQALHGVSKTTIKRAKKEYKQEKIMVHQDYIEQTVKKKIYKFLDRHPKSTLSDLREALPNVPPAKVSEYHLFWKKKQEQRHKKDATLKVGVSPRKLKDMIFRFLDENAGGNLEQLFRAFPEANQSSVSSYFNHWRKKQKSVEMGKEGGLYQAVIKYLDQNPQTQLAELKQVFSDVPKRSLEVYLNLWQKKREGEAAENKTLQKIVQEFIQQDETENRSRFANSLSTLSPSTGSMETGQSQVTAGPRKRGRPRKNPLPLQTFAGKSSAESMPSQTERPLLKQTRKNTGNRRQRSAFSDADQELIARLKKTIEGQRLTIRQLDAEHCLLKEQQPSLLQELEGMDEKELKEVRGFLSTYLNGLKNKPSGKSFS